MNTKKDLQDYPIFRSNLRKLRASLGKTGAELSAELKMPAKRINDLEEGRCRPKLDEVCALAKLFQCSIDNLIYSDVQMSVKFA